MDISPAHTFELRYNTSKPLLPLLLLWSGDLDLRRVRTAPLRLLYQLVELVLTGFGLRLSGPVKVVRWLGEKGSMTGSKKCST